MKIGINLTSTKIKHRKKPHNSSVIGLAWAQKNMDKKKPDHEMEEKKHA